MPTKSKAYKKMSETPAAGSPGEVITSDCPTGVAHMDYEYDISQHGFGDGASMAYGGSGFFPAIFDQWVTETLVYDPLTQKTTYSLNGATPVEYDYWKAPTKTTLELGISSYGWFTGHYMEIDYIKLEQAAAVDTAPPDVAQLAVNPNPASVGTPVTLTATVNDSSTGGSTITSAEYRLNDGPWIAMSASDGSFDSFSEAVTATFTAERIGNNQVCIRGTDAAENTSSGGTCISFQVIYVFTGFYAPVDMPGSGGTLVVNIAKPGQAIPVKWRLTTGTGSPISDPASFKTLLIRTINCQSLVGDPAPIEQYVSAGASGLQYLDNGYWQYNWKTPKTDTGCRTLAVEFNSGQTSPVAYIQFK